MEYPLVNYLPQVIFAAVWFFPGLILGIIFGWRAHITFVMAQDGSLEEEGFKKPISFLVKKHSALTPVTEEPAAEEHKPGEFFW